jgi:hypothetical protein
MSAVKKNGGRLTTVFNPSGATLKLVNGGTKSVRNTSSRSSKNRGRNRKRTNPTTATKNPSSHTTRRRRRRNPPSKAGIGVIIRQLALGGVGAFAVNTASQFLPIQFNSPVMALVLRAALAYGIGAGATRVMGEANGSIVRIGGFAVVAGEAVNIFMPNLQQRIMQYSPVVAAPRAAIGAGATAPVVEGSKLSGIVEYDDDGTPYMIPDEDDNLSGLVNIPKESPLYGTSYYYG